MCGWSPGSLSPPISGSAGMLDCNSVNKTMAEVLMGPRLWVGWPSSLLKPEDYSKEETPLLMLELVVFYFFHFFFLLFIYFFYFILFLNFTILYWFCHTSTSRPSCLSSCGIFCRSFLVSPMLPVDFVFASFIALIILCCDYWHDCFIPHCKIQGRNHGFSTLFNN